MNRQLKRIDNSPYVTIGLLGIMVIVFLPMTVMGGSTNTYVLIQFGAKVSSLIQAGQWWRLFTPVFAHWV